MIEDINGDARGPAPGDSATSVSRVRSVQRRTNGYVVLDSTWARHLGIRRSGGMYRITRRELMERLKRALEVPSHFVGFYETEAFLVDSVCDFLVPGLLAGDAAIVVATEAHRDSFDRALMAAGIELPEAQRCGRYIALDASEALATFMVDGMPAWTRFSTAIGQLVSRAAEGARNVRIYGEMVAVLWDEGNVGAAIAVEDFWNDIATKYPFSLFCAYPMRVFEADASTEGLRTICGQHSKVLLQNQGI